MQFPALRKYLRDSPRLVQFSQPERRVSLPYNSTNDGVSPKSLFSLPTPLKYYFAMEFSTSYSSFSAATSDTPCPMRLPAYRSCHLGRYHPYPRFRASRHVEYEDLVKPMVTASILKSRANERHRLTRTSKQSTAVTDPYCPSPFTGPRLDQLLPTIAEDDGHGLESLDLAVSGKSPEGRTRRTSLTTLVIVCPLMTL